jgi:ATP-binding cassette subfamily C (CFTR/MRP) protein 1
MSMARDVAVSAHDQKWTDARARLLRELLGTMQIIKVFTYEIPFLKRKQ